MPTKIRIKDRAISVVVNDSRERSNIGHKVIIVKTKDQP